MPTEYESYANSTAIHYCANSSERCHASVISGSFIVDAGPTSADLIQLDAVNLGIIVPLERAAVNYDDTATHDPWHYLGSCPRT